MHRGHRQMKFFTRKTRVRSDEITNNQCDYFTDFFKKLLTQQPDARKNTSENDQERPLLS